jgi:hypothetical protein
MKRDIKDFVKNVGLNMERFGFTVQNLGQHVLLFLHDVRVGHH